MNRLKIWVLVTTAATAVLGLACGGGGGSQAAPTATPAPATNVAASDWCLAGQLWTPAVSAASGGQILSARIEGVVEFKGKRYCKAAYEVETGGQKARYSYYFNQDSTDIWAVIDIGGQVQEMHLSGGN